MSKKVVLAFSGGLDTSISVSWLKKKHNLDVITTIVDIGQDENFDEIEKKAYSIGASKHYTIDAKQEFINNYIFSAIKSNALYQNKYPLATALGRPLIAYKLIEIANQENTKIFSHGCTGKGNDQARFDVTLRSVMPDAKIIAPVRDENMSRDEEIQYAKDLNVSIEKKSQYSIDENLWGRSIEGGILEDSFEEPPKDIYKWVDVDSSLADKYIEIDFNNGIPVSIDGIADSLEMITHLNDVAGKYGIGVVDHIEDRLMGIKSREIYEAPAATVLIEAHKDLEKLVLTRNELEIKSLLEQKWSWMIYSGLFVDPLVKAIDSFINKTQERVNGTVRLKLKSNSLTVVGRKSENSIYDQNLSSYSSSSDFNQTYSKGFIEIWGLQSKFNEGETK
ncbi:MAG TPA: argininosuccinate synthase [Nitrososphaerales archaeon]|nr:argininosuccinate synthase [Nitrososphaerales archaeon]NSL74435.1 argininosuccinate synthase [Nitrososphaerota archaeon]PXF22967.1 MAG: argininosuccinate synthase [Nitrososphaerota archaeon]HIC84494.1 argininosuccinate synthase [Nitrososphaerales archaeon]